MTLTTWSERGYCIGVTATRVIPAQPGAVSMWMAQLATPAVLFGSFQTASRPPDVMVRDSIVKLCKAVVAALTASVAYTALPL